METITQENDEWTEVIEKGEKDKIEKIGTFDVLADVKPCYTKAGEKINLELANIYAAHKNGGDFRSLVTKLVNKTVPISRIKDPMWESASRDLFTAAILSLLNNDKIDAGKFNIGRIKLICGMGDFGDHLKNFYRDNKPTRLYNYYRIQDLECRQLADAVVSNSENTARNTLCILYTYLTKY